MTLDQLPIGKEAVITTVGGEGALRLRLLVDGVEPACRKFSGRDSRPENGANSVCK